MTDENMIEFVSRIMVAVFRMISKTVSWSLSLPPGRSGTGLGLAVVNATVSSFNGKFDIQSEAGVGSCLTHQASIHEQKHDATE